MRTFWTLAALLALVAGCSKPASTTPRSDAGIGCRRMRTLSTWLQTTSPTWEKAAVRPWVDGYFKAYKALWDKPVQEFVVSGDWAFERYSYKSVDTPKDGGAAMKTRLGFRGVSP
jgi:phosphodiesterase/alkaline phosphatase D-like protein